MKTNIWVYGLFNHLCVGSSAVSRWSNYNFNLRWLTNAVRCVFSTETMQHSKHIWKYAWTGLFADFHELLNHECTTNGNCYECFRVVQKYVISECYNRSERDKLSLAKDEHFNVCDVWFKFRFHFKIFSARTFVYVDRKWTQPTFGPYHNHELAQFF